MGRSIALLRVVAPSRECRALGAAALVLSLLVGCGGDRPGDLRSISATVSGLVGAGLVLQVNGTREVPVSGNGPVTLAYVPSGARFTVAVKTQPSNPTQDCVVTPNTVDVGSADVTEIAVTCVKTYAVGGSVTGLEGTGLVLRSSLGDDLPVAVGTTSFVFPTRGSAGTAYAVTVARHPSSPQQLCTVNGETGTLVDTDVLEVRVTCSTEVFTVGGTVANLAAGSTLVIQNNSTDDLQVDGGDGSFSFSVADGADYRVTVKQQPTHPWQTCTIQSGTGTVAGAPVESVRIACVENPRVVGGTISGLEGSGLKLRLLLDGDREDTWSADSVVENDFSFSGKGLAGSTYAVTVVQQPTSPAQNCSIANGSGTIGVGDATNVVVVCSKNLLHNSEFSLGFPADQMETWSGGWAFYRSTPNVTATGPGLNRDGWTLMDGEKHNNTAWVCQSNNTGVPGDSIDTYTERIEVTPGSRYVASAYVGAHRCKVDIYIGWLKSDETFSAVQAHSYDGYALGDSVVTGVASSNNWEVGPNASLIDARDGATLDRYKRIVQAGTVPPDARYAGMAFRKWNTKVGEPHSFMFVARAQFEEVAPGVTEPGPWIPTE